MKKLLLVVLLVLAATTFTFTSPAFAGNAAKGAMVFTANCNACHLGGKNVVNPTKTLSKSDLQKYDMNSIEAITKQVTYGKNAMPAFGGRLSPQQIEDVATYVLEQSDKGW
ncbi:MAG: cytochrome c6 PetJ [Xenococcaceae cyanobacterium]